VKLSRAIFIFWVPLVAWFLVIHNFSATPGKDLPHINIPNADKIFHALIFGILGMLLIRACDNSNFNVSLAKMVFLAIIITICYGAYDEWFQRTVPGRSCDLIDLLADSAGSTAGIFLYIADKRKRRE
jgi:VanZ family protein